MRTSTPTRGRYALDTNVAIAVLNGERVATEHWGAAEAVFLPAPVLAELLVGARRSARRSENEREVWRIAEEFGFICCDEEVCRHYAAVKSGLLAAGTPIPDNDIWVAACCFATGAMLVSRDNHFDLVGGLVREEWR